MHLDTITRRANLVTDAAAALERSIRSGMLHGGDRLPSETEIARQLGISRPVVREAIAFLKGDGIVETRHGRGLFVTEPDPSRLHARDIDASGEHILEFLEFRAGLEADAAALAAERRTEADLAGLEAALDRLAVAEREGRSGADEDLAFHLAIADAAHSYLFAKVLRFLSVPLLETMRYMRKQDERSDAYIANRRAAHCHIHDRIKAQDPDGARAAMRTHMVSAHDRYAAVKAKKALRKRRKPQTR